jgi:hypothetical protein
MTCALRRASLGVTVVITLVTATLLSVQDAVRFEHVQKDLFAAGGAYVNAWADYDGDGDVDQFVGFDGAPNRLYRNDRGAFADVAASAGIGDARPTRAAAWGDADADGDPDLLVGFTPGSSSVLHLYRNDGGRFIDRTDAVGLSVAGGAVRQPVWVDFDGDLDLDLFVAFRDRPNALYRNDGMRFIDVAPRVGLADPRRTVGAVWFDADEDGDLDVITGNMDGDANGLFRQDRGMFTDIAEATGVAWGGRTPGDKANGTVRPCVADVDNDGHLDLFFANYGRNGLFLNRGRGRFEDASARWGIAIDARYDSCAFADADNDGDLDLYVNGTVTGGQQYRDYLFRNTGAAYEDVTPSEVGSPNSDHGVQWVDYDLDGAVDLALTGVQKDGMHWLLRNMLGTPRTTRALHVRVLDASGRGTTAGAEVTVRSSGRIVGKRLIDAGSGYNSQNDQPLHVGMSGTPRVSLQVAMPRPGGAASVTVEADVARSHGRVLNIRLRR